MLQGEALLRDVRGSMRQTQPDWTGMAGKPPVCPKEMAKRRDMLFPSRTPWQGPPVAREANPTPQAELPTHVPAPATEELLPAKLIGPEAERSRVERACRDWMLVASPQYDEPFVSEMDPFAIKKIVQSVARHYRVSVPDILSARRTAAIIRPRQVAMYLSKVLTPRSLPEIGKHMGGRDHTTVLYGARRVEALLADGCEDTTNAVEAISAHLTSALGA